MTQSRRIRSSPRFPLSADEAVGAPAARPEPPFFFCSTPLRFRIACFVGLFILVSAPVAAEPTDKAYLSELIQRSIEQKLADEREWHLLLHYRTKLFGGYASEQDDPGFFLSPDGKTDPQAELEATLTQFFSGELVGRSRQPAQCAFVARYHWLKEKLAFDDVRLTPIKCERFEKWFVEFDAQAITLIFPAAFLNNPASMFGHTLLRVDQAGQTEQTRILAYTINYAADIPPGEGLAYPVRGIFGGYRGYFSTIPYYMKVQEYRDIENRDIWEYRLNFSPLQIRRLLMHAWELGNASFDYFFFKENCSYHLLSLLEYADPNRHLTDSFLFWTVPADTVRLVVAQPGLVGDIAYRPSRSTMIRRKREMMSGQERSLSNRIVHDVSLIQSVEFMGLPVKRQAFVLDVASDYLRYKSETDDSHAATYKERNRAVLTARSELKIQSEDLKIIPFAKQPELGHKTSRAGVGGGWRNNDTYEELAIRAGYHDLLDPEIGYTPDAQIELLAARLRHYNRINQTRLESFTLANIISLSPMDSLFKSPSWKINAGMQSLLPERSNAGCQYCSTGVVNGGVGAAADSHLLNREVYFAFGELEADVGRGYSQNYRLGGGGTVGFMTDLTERWKILASTSYLRFPLGDRSDDFRWFVGQRYTLGQNFAVRLEYNHRDHDNDVLFTVQAYF